MKYRLATGCWLILFAVSAAFGAGEYQWRSLAGAADAGAEDGTGSAAQFSDPRGAAVDASGNVFVADGGNHTIRKITPRGEVSTFAGLAGSNGFANGLGSAARFNAPCGVAVDDNGNVYVADTGNHIIRKITAAGDVSTLAGVPSATGASVDGLPTRARFFAPEGLAADAVGNVYVADTGNHTIRAVSAGGFVTTIAGEAGKPGGLEFGSGSSPGQFRSPSGIALDRSTGDLYVADTGNHSIRKVSGGFVYTVAGDPDSPGHADGDRYSARFQAPYGVAMAQDGSGNLYVADTENSLIRRITGAGDSYFPFNVRITTVGGLDQPSAPGRFDRPPALAITSDYQLVVSSGNSIVSGTATPVLRLEAYGTSPLTSGSTIDWGEVGYRLAHGTPRSYTLANVGLAPFTNLAMSVDPGVASEWGWQFPTGTLAPGERADITLLCQGKELGQRITTLHITSSDPVVPSFDLILTATVVDEPPVLSVGVSSSNADFYWARAGDILRLSISANEYLQKPSATIAGQVATVTGFGADWEAAITVQPDAPQGPVAFSVTAQDLSGNTATTTKTYYPTYIPVIDTVAPGLPPPANLTVEATSRNGALATYSAYSSDKVPATFNPPSGSAFRFGATTVTATVADAAGNATVRTFSVTVVDTIPPALSYPAKGITVEATGAAGAVVNFTVSANDLVDGARPVAATSVSGSLFPVGTTTVNLSASDAHNNVANRSFTVTVRDTVKPVLVQPANLVVESTRPDGAIVTYPSASATDLVGPVTVSYSVPSGSVFPIGTTRVFANATDGANNVSPTTSFTVTVRDTIAPAITGAFYPRMLVIGEPVPDYLAQATFSDVSPLSLKSQNPLAGTLVTSSLITVYLSAKDAAGNEGTTSFPVEVRPAAQLSTLLSVIRPGSLVNPAAHPGGPPRDAKFVSYGDPAIDDAGTVAVTYHWMSPRYGRGSTVGAFSRSVTTGATLIPGALSIGAAGRSRDRRWACGGARFTAPRRCADRGRHPRPDDRRRALLRDPQPQSGARYGRRDLQELRADWRFRQQSRFRRPTRAEHGSAGHDGRFRLRRVGAGRHPSAQAAPARRAERRRQADQDAGHFSSRQRLARAGARLGAQRQRRHANPCAGHLQRCYAGAARRG
jgi:sugar lactone lactonase YvrE